VVRALLAPLVIVAYLLLHPLIMTTFLTLVILMIICMRRVRPPQNRNQDLNLVNKI